MSALFIGIGLLAAAVFWVVLLELLLRAWTWWTRRRRRCIVCRRRGYGTSFATRLHHDPQNPGRFIHPVCWEGRRP